MVVSSGLAIPSSPDSSSNSRVLAAAISLALPSPARPGRPIQFYGKGSAGLVFKFRLRWKPKDVFGSDGIDKTDILTTLTNALPESALAKHKMGHKGVLNHIATWWRHGCGLIENVIGKWILSRVAVLEIVVNTMEMFSNVNFATSEQHVDNNVSRISRDADELNT
ncbi:hypothetical protein FQR65_LT14056 [Abscondita terminalis]|nr:hypothetical protein FQR65_LT14056 [Abscondita terminalis]